MLSRGMWPRVWSRAVPQATAGGFAHHPRGPRRWASAEAGKEKAQQQQQQQQRTHTRRRAAAPFVDTASQRMQKPTLASAMVVNPMVFFTVVGTALLVMLFDEMKGGFRRAFGRLLAVAGESTVVATYYQWIDMWETDPLNSIMARCRCHEVAAHRWLDLALDWGGIYVKMGQTASTMTQYLPLEWCIVMKPCLDHANQMSVYSVDEVCFKSRDAGGLGGLPGEFFDDFSHIPEKSASLAQVHRAKRKVSGETVAVKLQYDTVPMMMLVDLNVIGLVSSLVGWHFGCDMNWLHEYFKKSLDEETDFIREGKNCDRFREMFADWDDVTSPRVHWDTSSGRVLTMEWIDGFNVDSRAEMEARGIDTGEVATRMAQVVASSIFDHGYLHADPHAANVFVAPKEGTGRVYPKRMSGAEAFNKLMGTVGMPGYSLKLDPEEHVAAEAPPPPRCESWTLQWLDHGLYQEVSDTVRTQYAKLWAAIGTRDVAGVEAACKGMGVTNWRLLGRILGGTAPVAMEGTTTTSETLSRDDFFLPHTADTNMALGLLEVMGELPQEVILLLKCNALLRSVQTDLGVPVTYGKVMARAAVNHLTVAALKSAASPAERKAILAQQRAQLRAINARGA